MHVRRPSSQKAFRLLEEMRQEELQTSVFTLCSHLCMCEGQTHRKGLGAPRREAQKCLQPDVIMYNAAFGACQEAMQSDKVSELLAEIKQLP